MGECNIINPWMIVCSVSLSPDDLFVLRGSFAFAFALLGMLSATILVITLTGAVRDQQYDPTAVVKYNMTWHDLLFQLG